MATEFQTVTLEAEHVPEVSRTLEPDHTISEQDLPGMVNVYLVINGARLLFTQYKAGKVFDALAQHKAKQPAQTTTAAPPAPAQEAPPEPTTAADTPADAPPEQPQA